MIEAPNATPDLKTEEQHSEQLFKKKMTQAQSSSKPYSASLAPLGPAPKNMPGRGTTTRALRQQIRPLP